MASGARDRDRERLEQQLQIDDYQDLLRNLQRKEPFLLRFGTWADVVAFMRNGASRDPRKDEILRPILRAHGEDQDPRWRMVLLTLFWPGLKKVQAQKCHWDTDLDDLWQNVCWTFLRVLYRIDVTRRPDHLAQKIINDTIHHLHDGCRRTWTRMSREVLMDPEEMEDVADLVVLDFAGIDRQVALDIELERLREHLEGGRVTEADFLLLVGTRLYGRSVADYADDVGLNYATAKKRRQRAEAAIRRFEAEMQ